MAVRLIAEKGTLSGLVLSLEDGDQWQVGRDPSQNDIVLEDKTVAKSQALFFKNENGFFVRNLDQKVPIKVNDKIITKDTLLKEKDTILLGSTLFSLINDLSEDANDLFIFDEDDDEDDSSPNHESAQKNDPRDERDKKKFSTDEKDLEKSKNTNQKEEKLKENDKKKALLSEIKQDTQSEQTMKKDKEVSQDIKNKEEPSAASPNNLQNSGEQNQDKEGRFKTDDIKDTNQAKSPDKANPVNLDKNSKTEEGSQKGTTKEPIGSPQDTKSQKSNDAIVTSSQNVSSKKNTENAASQKQEPSVAPSTTLTTPIEPLENLEKKADKFAFSIEDLFDFDDGIFPEMDPQTKPAAGAPDDDYFVDLSHVSRFLLKVISGPNVGAEYSLDVDHEYLLGSDSSKCDIVFNDLSVSHQHAKLKISHEGILNIEDLSSRNGVIIEGNHIEKESVIAPDAFVGLGTTVFVIIDHQVPAETIVASPFLDMHDFAKDSEQQEGQKRERSQRRRRRHKRKNKSKDSIQETNANNQQSEDEQKDDMSPDDEGDDHSQDHNYDYDYNHDDDDYDYDDENDREEVDSLVNKKVQEELKKDKNKTFISVGSLIIALCMGGFAILFGIGTASLFHSQEISAIPEADYEPDLEQVVHSFPGVKFTFNKNSGQLFLLGHVKNGIDKSELLYKLEALPFIRSVDDNIIDDEAVWQEMNILLAKHLHMKGISMHSPEPGSFVIAGYVKTEAQLNELLEFLNLHFNYLSLLTNKVYVESEVVAHIKELLFRDGLTGLNVSFSVGELTLTGYINNKDKDNYQHLLTDLSQVTGVRNVKNFAVVLPLEEGVIDLSSRYPNRYQVTGYSKHGDVNINIVINGKILMRGDTIDGMTITSIQANSVFLEKEGLKYKIDYNK